MNVASWLLWSFVATLCFSVLMGVGLHLHFTRASFPFLLGTMFTPSRTHAKLVGTLMHFVNGALLALLYVAAFESWRGAGILRGLLVGAVHGAAALVLVFPTLPSLHPRMASEHSGPTAQRQLEPPGMLALHYGRYTPHLVFLGHLLFGAVLGGGYHVR